MSDRPIIFSAPMVRALIDGRKTQTRRVLKLPTKTAAGQRIYERPDMGGWEATTVGGGASFTIGSRGERIPAPECAAIWHRTCGACIAAPYAVGDRLWVREAWRMETSVADEFAPSQLTGMCPALYDADTDWSLNKSTGKRRVAIHMPRWASRLTLVVTGVKVERLQSISPADTIAEGAQCPTCEAMGSSACARMGCFASMQAFRDLWNSIHGPDAWDANPWVICLTFRPILQNIDSLENRP